MRNGPAATGTKRFGYGERLRTRPATACVFTYKARAARIGGASQLWRIPVRRDWGIGVTLDAASPEPGQERPGATQERPGAGARAVPPGANRSAVEALDPRAADRVLDDHAQGLELIPYLV